MVSLESLQTLQTWSTVLSILSIFLSATVVVLLGINLFIKSRNCEDETDYDNKEWEHNFRVISYGETKKEI